MRSLQETLLASPAGELWKKIGVFPHHGIDLPLSALHSKNSAGIGEFFDLLPLIDWCKTLKMDVIQLLPLNDSGNDPSPYNALSSCAINPIFLSLHALPYLEEFPDLQKKLEPMRGLTRSQKIPYHEIKIQKLYWLRLYYASAGARILKLEAFQKFVAENHGWALPYGVFKILKDLLEQSQWQYWPEELKHLSKKRYDEIVELYWEEICFYLVVQYLACIQLKQVKEHAERANVKIKGDVPILVSVDSADVWHHQGFFDLTLAAGAPPDSYSNIQQYWGFPLYHWDVKKKSHYSWWKQRLQMASHFFHLYRLDHVVGLFRIWAIPVGQQTTKGRFVPEDESLWIPQGKDILQMMISSFPMLPIAEDLGEVPPAVIHSLEEFGIPGTRVMRWQRYWHEDKRFIPFDQYPPLSMTCVSTHDSETLAEWWRDHPEGSGTFAALKGWKYAPELTSVQRKEILFDSHHTSSIFHINLLQEYFALFPDLVWTRLEDERINIPGKILPTNWTYRFRPSVEEIVAHEGLQKEISEILTGATQAEK
ncbi:MAG: 4-alpha-glucanotransferase [Chlamydiales bacterium]